MNRRDVRQMSGPLVVALVLLAGCSGGDPDVSAVDAEMPVGERSEESPGEVTEFQPLKLDYGHRPPVAGFVRFTGSCDTFPCNFQYPQSWEMTGSLRLHVSNQLRDGSGFAMVIHADYGSMHVANFERMLMAQGASEVGRVQVGGHEVKVLGLGGNYLLHTPHGPGYFFHRFAVDSELGLESTLRILNTLEPLPDC
jgi:hypothetical protein